MAGEVPGGAAEGAADAAAEEVTAGSAEGLRAAEAAAAEVTAADVSAGTGSAGAEEVAGADDAAVSDEDAADDALSSGEGIAASAAETEGSPVPDASSVRLSPDVTSPEAFSAAVSPPPFPRSTQSAKSAGSRTARKTAAILILRRALSSGARFSFSLRIFAVLLSVFRVQKKMPPVFRPMTSSSSALFDFITAQRRFASLSARHPASICRRARGTVACIRHVQPLRRRPQEGSAAEAGKSGAGPLPYISDKLLRHLRG